MQIGNITKLVVAVLITVTVGVLAFYGKIAEQAVTALLGALAGYILGNGHAIISNKVNNTKDNNKDV